MVKRSLVVLVLLFTVPFATADLPLAVNFIDVGQGDAIYVQSPNGKTMLIDGGERNGMAERYLDSIGVKTIDVVVATHPHLDHIGGLPAIIQKYDVKQIVMPRVTSVTTVIYQNLLETIRAKGLRVTEGKAGLAIDFCPSVIIECLAPNSAEYRDVNDHSIVLKLTQGDVSFLLTGDATAVSEREMLQHHSDKLKSTVLKIGHHGSSTSSTVAFMNAVNPQYAVFCVGRDNSYGHPTQEVWNRVSGLSIFRTDVQGTIILTSDGKTVAAYGAFVNGQYPEMTPYRGALRLTQPVAQPIAQPIARPPPPVAQPIAQPVVQPIAQTASNDIVYRTNTGRMYHREGCRSLSQSQIPISRSDAIRRGLTACSVCNP